MKIHFTGTNNDAPHYIEIDTLVAKVNIYFHDNYNPFDNNECEKFATVLIFNEIERKWMDPIPCKYKNESFVENLLKLLNKRTQTITTETYNLDDDLIQFTRKNHNVLIKKMNDEIKIIGYPFEIINALETMNFNWYDVIENL